MKPLNLALNILYDHYYIFETKLEANRSLLYIQCMSDEYMTFYKVTIFIWRIYFHFYYLYWITMYQHILCHAIYKISFLNKIEKKKNFLFHHRNSLSSHGSCSFFHALLLTPDQRDFCMYFEIVTENTMIELYIYNDTIPLRHNHNFIVWKFEENNKTWDYDKFYTLFSMKSFFRV